MIETRKALENLEEIVAVPGLDAVYVGPSDLSFALGLTPKCDQEEKVFLEAIDRVVRAANAQGVVAGIHNGAAAYAQRMIDLGFRLVSISTDVDLMTAGLPEHPGCRASLRSWAVNGFAGAYPMFRARCSERSPRPDARGGSVDSLDRSPSSLSEPERQRGLSGDQMSLF